MKLVKVGAAVLNQIPMDWDGNTARILGAINQAKEKGVSILCLPEMAITGYGCEDQFHSRELQERALSQLQYIASYTKGIAVAVGLPIFYQNAVFNTAAFAVNGEIVGFVAKQNLAGDGVHYEPRWFKPWPHGVQGSVKVGVSHIPIGDLFFDIGGVKVGFEICEDAWTAHRPGGDLSLHGADVILNPSASHFAFGKFETRQRFVIEGSRAFGVTYVYTNLLGNESGRTIFDGGALIASGGRMVAQGKRFSFQDVVLTTAVVDIDATRTATLRTGSYQPALQDGLVTIEKEFFYPEIEPAVNQLTIEAWERSAELKKEEFSRAVTIGLFDFMRKSHCNGFVVSLSGGVDSSACACLVSMMIEFGDRELGASFGRKLGYMTQPFATYLPGDEAAFQRRKLWAKWLLTCAYQGTENSSKVTHDAAEGLARQLGAEFHNFDVGNLVKDYIGMVEKSIGRKLDWKNDDITLQNIQARVRGPGVWMLANIKNALLLTTSNRSEAAVGYCTMDGDTCGSLAPIAGIDKAFLREWLRWVEKEGPDGLQGSAVCPNPALAAVNNQQPTAELRPQKDAQTDEKDLAPYIVLDVIEKLAIRDKLMPMGVFRSLRPAFPQYSVKDLHTWVERFFKLWARNQWKRDRTAPGLMLDDESLDPKTWCRFPLLSSGFARELEELNDYVRKL